MIDFNSDHAVTKTIPLPLKGKILPSDLSILEAALGTNGVSIGYASDVTSISFTPEPGQSKTTEEIDAAIHKFINATGAVRDCPHCEGRGYIVQP